MGSTYRSRVARLQRCSTKFRGISVSLEDAEKVAKIFMPPEWHPSARLKFDLAVVIWLGVISMGVAVHVAIACGYLTFIYPGFATAAEVSTQQIQLSSIQANMVQNNIDRDRRQICEAQAARNQAALTAWSLELQRDIIAFTGIPKIQPSQPQIRSCDELLISGTNG